MSIWNILCHIFVSKLDLQLRWHKMITLNCLSLVTSKSTYLWLSMLKISPCSFAILSQSGDYHSNNVDELVLLSSRVKSNCRGKHSKETDKISFILCFLMNLFLTFFHDVKRSLKYFVKSLHTELISLCNKLMFLSLHKI